jgi:nitrogen fixation NifU-like protein
LKGATVARAEALFDAVHALLTDEHADVDEDDLGSLMALAGVRRYPMRVKCATLSWHALKAALGERQPDAVTTE